MGPMTLRFLRARTPCIPARLRAHWLRPRPIGKLSLHLAPVRGDTNMVNPIGNESSPSSLNGDGPPEQTGLVTNDSISSTAAAERGS